MTQTTYYEFNKPEGADLVNPLVDTNPNWDKLDNDLHEFNERSIANCTEVVTLGVHAISRLDTTSKFLKWIATANFTAGETFTVDGLAVAAATPSGATLASNAYVTGSVVLACLNADNTAMTIYVSGTNVATDSERLGGELPSYYGTAADVADNATDITNLQNQVGNTSIVGIGDGTCTGAIDALNTLLKGGTIMKAVDFSNPIKLDDGTYIAADDCVIAGNGDLQANATYITFTINGKDAVKYLESNSTKGTISSYYPVGKGQTVTITCNGNRTAACSLGIYPYL